MSFFRTFTFFSSIALFSSLSAFADCNIDIAKLKTQMMKQGLDGHLIAQELLGIRAACSDKKAATPAPNAEVLSTAAQLAKALPSDVTCTDRVRMVAESRSSGASALVVEPRAPREPSSVDHYSPFEKVDAP